MASKVPLSMNMCTHGAGQSTSGKFKFVEEQLVIFLKFRTERPVLHI